MYTKIILASSSPRRVAILKQMGIQCLVMPADIDESSYINEMPADYVQRLAMQKAQAIATNLKKGNLKKAYVHLPILAADTTVALDVEILGKPENAEDATKMLKKLSGTTHQVHTAVAVILNNQCEIALSTTNVQMMPLTDAMIAAYIATGEHADKAGSYGIQGLAGNWIKFIEGSYTGVMGLPMHETAMLLDKFV